MDPEQLVAQLTELRTQNQHLHQALQQMQQQQAQHQGLVQALTELPESLAQTVGAAVVAATNPARANPTLVDTRGLGKPPSPKNTESDFASWARRTENFVVSVHPGARDVSTGAVERESATVTEAHAATEVVMPLDTLRMLADQLYRVLMTLVEGESFNILVGSGSREGLEAWRRLHKRWDPLTTGRARGLLREILPPGRASAKHVELQGAVERLEDLMRRDTQRQDACRRHQDGGVGSASSRRTRATLPTPAVTAGHVPETERRSPPLRGSKRIRCTQPGSSCKGPRGQISSHGCWRIWTMERTTRLQGKGREPHMLDLRENRSTIEGLLGKATAATERRTIKIFWKRKRRRRQVWQRWKERQIQRGWSTCLESTD